MIKRGWKINDSGHNYNAYKGLDDQETQKHILISTLFDPREKDPEYETDDPTDPSKSGHYDTDLPYPKRRYLNPASFSSAQNNFAEGNPPNGVASVSTTTRPDLNVPEETSWIAYKQSYEITETNPTIPTESLSASHTKDDFTDQVYDRRYGVTYDPDITPDNIKSIISESGLKLQGRTVDRHPDDVVITDENDPGYNADLKVATRRTYATSPSRYYLTVKGYAIRLGYKIPIPTVMYIAGEKAIRVGNARVKHQNLGADADTPVYLAM